MKPEQQIKALAELDGWTQKGSVGRSHYPAFVHGDGRKVATCNLPPYLKCYDAIIPLIQKQSEHIKTQLADFLGEIALPDYDGSDEFHYSVLHYLICAKPAQLCEALLRATGKWIE